MPFLNRLTADPRISVVIPVHGNTGTLASAIGDALAQTLPPLEIIVIDDASDPPVVLAAADPRVRLMRLARNAGPSFARNRGSEAARGDWIAFLDSDDGWLPDKLAVQFALPRPPGPVLLACNVTVDDGARQRPYNVGPPTDPLDAWILIERQSLQTSGLVLPRMLALAFPFDEMLRGFEDWDLILRLDVAGVAIAYNPACLVRYRVSATKYNNRSRWASERAWLRRSDAPASAHARFVYYLSVKAWHHARHAPFAAFATLAWLFGATPHAGATLRRTLVQRWRQRHARRG